MIHSRITEPLFLPLVPPSARDAVMVLWALDARLGAMAREGREPALRQIRLKWWEEQLRTLGAEGCAAPSDPLLLRCMEILVGRIDTAHLAGLAEAWGNAVADTADVEPGAILFGLTAALLGEENSSPAVAQAGRAWAMVERLLPGESMQAPLHADDWCAAARAFDGVSQRALPRSLACLVALNRRIARKGGRRAHLAEQGLVLRVGLLGF